MSSQEIQRKYAQLILQKGINIQKGQKLKIKSENIHQAFVSTVVEEAYKMGCTYVDVDLYHESFLKARIDHGPEEGLDFVPKYLKESCDEIGDGSWALLRFDGAEDPELLVDLDQKRNSRVQKATRSAMESLHKKVSSHYFSWCIAALPTPKWAAQIFNCAANKEAEERLWEKLIPILRLDQEDPLKAWQKNADELGRRAKFLTDTDFEWIHFEGPRTDFKVKLVEGSHWAGGASPNHKGHDFLANLPTEEVFTTPDWRYTEGTVQVTRPVQVLGGIVEGAFFEFKNGAVENYSAEKGKKYLDSFFEIDPRARYAGEIALVDCNSPIYKSGTIFHSILFDENAACHFALGSAYPLGFERSTLSKEELQEKGMNQSILHTDFMLGSEEINVQGIKKDGDKTQLIEKGQFVI